MGRALSEVSMKASWSIAMASGILAVTAAALYACSSETTGNTPTEAGTDTGTPDTGGGETGTDAPPASCAIFNQAGSNAPSLSPQACSDCAKANCCTSITKCYGAPAADAGYDGSNGKKTNCELYGECEALCTPGDLVCPAQCAQDFGGTGVADDWGQYSDCLYGTGAGKCQQFCQ
jgi:hypothetical protein